MEEKKIYSLRLDSETLEWANKIASHATPWTRSDVIRLAIWIGTKVITSKCFYDLIRLMVHDDFLDGKITLEGVLRTIGIELENLKKEE